jgi:hypothetical protein
MPSGQIGKRGRWQMSMAEHSRTIRERQARAPITVKVGTFARIVQRGEVAFLYDQGCIPTYDIPMVEFDESPWDRYLLQSGRFVCPGCRRLMMMHVHYGPGTPATERFQETV